MLRTLHARLAMVLLLVLLLFGAVDLIVTLATTDFYQREVAQSLDRDLAHQIASMKQDMLLTEAGELRQEGPRELFHWLMVVNPGLEFYLLEEDGQILHYDAPPDVVVRQQVSLEPLHRFLASEDPLPIFGDDPRDPSGRKVFSASPVPVEGPVAGYLYIVLDSQELQSAADRLAGSYILRLAMWTLLGALGVALVAGLGLFRRVTRPLRRLTRRMSDFGEEGGAPQGAAPVAGGEEVRILESTFEAMRHRIEAQIQEIERVEGLRRELIANISHDLRTPIALLRGYLDTLVLKRGTLPEDERRHYVDIALRQSERLGTMVDELFELTQLEAREVEPRFERFSITELLQDNVQRYRLAAEKEGIRIEGRYDRELPSVEADIGMIERVLENLVTNAIRFTPPEGKVTLELVPVAEKVWVRVADTGCGIAAAELPHIFDRYYRCRAAEGSAGTGLGLAIARRILDLHDSTIEVDSTPGSGTTFSFPLRIAA